MKKYKSVLEMVWDTDFFDLGFKLKFTCIIIKNKCVRYIVNFISQRTPWSL